MGENSTAANMSIEQTIATLREWDTAARGHYTHGSCEGCAVMQRLSALGRNCILPLVEALIEQWEVNHAEHCTNMRHQPDETTPCRWPLPAALALVAEQVEKLKRS